MFLSCAGTQVTGVDYKPGGNAAARATVLLGADEALLTKSNLHITLVIGEGCVAKDSNDLPGLVEQGQAVHVALQEPVQLTGQVLAFVRG